MFRHDLIELPKLQRIDEGMRRYVTPSGNEYPSVTTVLGEFSDDSWLKEWKARVGEAEAEKVSKTATRRGTIVHGLCEDFVLNRKIDTRREMPFNLMMFNQIKRVLAEHVNDIRGSELFLYSDKLKVAGACDLIASYDNEPATIDFKTSKKRKTKEDIRNYFLQTAMYSYMFFDRTKLLYNKLVVIMCVEEENEAQVFIEDARDWIEEAYSLCQKFHQIKKIC